LPPFAAHKLEEIHDAREAQRTERRLLKLERRDLIYQLWCKKFRPDLLAKYEANPSLLYLGGAKPSSTVAEEDLADIPDAVKGIPPTPAASSAPSSA
jgi:hypothetical protein